MNLYERFPRMKKSVGTDLKDFEGGQPNMQRMRAYRMGRLQAELKRLDYAGAVLFDPINIRYATGSRNMAVWTLHNAARYCFVPAEGRAVLFDFHNCEHLADGLETIAEVRPAKAFFFFSAGNRAAEKAELWAEELADVIRKAVGPQTRRIAFDHLDPLGLHAMTKRGFQVFDAQEPCELARAIKSPDEIACMLHAIAVCEAGMARMYEEMKPGVTENDLWASLNDTNHRMGGEWIECRLLSSGGRTNPWFQECSDKIIRPGDIVSFDTDLIGPFGYCADISRTYLCGRSRGTDEQRKLFNLAMEQIHYNIELVKPGITCREFAEKAWRIPNAYVKNRYSCVAHGVGMCDEWPKVTHAQDVARSQYDATLLPGMTICIESYMGEEGGAEGVKLEEQVLVTETGCVVMSTFPFEERLI
jgi:Xaa-Pro aminopeptidase